jgi:hypothetical protein
MYNSLDDIDFDLMWKVSVPLCTWWMLSMLAVGARLRHRHFDLSTASIRNHVGITEDMALFKTSTATAKAEDVNTHNTFRQNSCWCDFDRFVLLTLEAIGYALSSLFYFCRWRRDKLERKRTALMIGEIFFEIQPFFAMLVWAIAVLCVRGGLAFGLLLLFVGQPSILLLWYAFAWRAAGWDYRNMV